MADRFWEVVATAWRFLVITVGVVALATGLVMGVVSAFRDQDGGPSPDPHGQCYYDDTGHLDSCDPPDY